MPYSGAFTTFTDLTNPIFQLIVGRWATLDKFFAFVGKVGCVPGVSPFNTPMRSPYESMKKSFLLHQANKGYPVTVYALAKQAFTYWSVCAH